MEDDLLFVGLCQYVSSLPICVFTAEGCRKMSQASAAEAAEDRHAQP